MGFTNGQHEKPSRVEKVKIKKSTPGLKLTPDNHFHLQNKRLTNISAPMNDHDAVTKRFVTDLLKTKASTRYVNNELAKKSTIRPCPAIHTCITVYAESNSFGNDKQYGWPSPVDGKIVRASICARADTEASVCLVINGACVSNGKITKPLGQLSDHTIFSDPITIKAGDLINFQSETSAMVNLLIEIVM